MVELLGEFLGELALKLVVGVAELLALELLRRLTRGIAGTAGLRVPLG